MSINNEYVSCIIQVNNRNIILKGSVKNPSNFKKKVVIAPNPIDIRLSYNGSGLPFPNEEIAFQNTKNFYEISQDGVIDTTFIYPNSYYSPDGLTKIKSPVIFIFDDNKFIVELEDLCPLKTLRDRKRSDPSFYALKEIILPVATAENNMRNYASAKAKYNIA